MANRLCLITVIPSPGIGELTGPDDVNEPHDAFASVPVSVMPMIRFAISALLLAVFGQGVFASPPRITSIWPPSAARGGSTLFSIRGVALSGARLFISGPGVTLGKPQPAPDGLRVRLTVDPDTAPGPRELRAVTSSGASGALAVWIGVYPQRAEAEPNDDLQSAEPPVRGPTSIYGRIASPSDTDVFSFEGKVGEDWALDCTPMSREGVPAPSVELSGPDGESLGSWQANYLRSARAHFKLDRAGRYTVAVRPGMGNDRLDLVYLCTIGRVPFIERFSPYGEKPGRMVGLEIAGDNLGGTRRIRITVPPDTEVGSWQTAKTASGPALPFFYPVADIPTVAVTESDQTMALPLVPAALEGKFEATRVARFFYEAKPGEALGFDLHSADIGSAARATLRVLDSENRVVTGEGTPGGSPVRGTFTARQLTRITVELTNATGRLGPECFYRLEVEKPVPGFRAVARRTGLILAAGGSATIPVLVERSGGFIGAVEIVASGLPPGITVGRRTAGRAQSTVDLVVAASSAASREPFLLRLEARATVDGKRVSKSLRAVDPSDSARRELSLLPVSVLPPGAGTASPIPSMSGKPK